LVFFIGGSVGLGFFFFFPALDLGMKYELVLSKFGWIDIYLDIWVTLGFDLIF